jgi:hypothetical protein
VFITEVIVGLASGAFGALGAPWITHRLSGTTRLAERREEPYARILAAAAELVEASGAKGQMIARMVADDIRFPQAWTALDEAVRAADAVSSPEIREKVSTLKAKSTLSVHEHANIPKKPSSEMHLEDLEPAWHAELQMRAAYEALRDEVQRETRG